MNKLKNNDDVMISNQIVFKELSPEDIQFYEVVSSRITSSNALPFDLPAKSVFDIIRRGLKFFWDWYELATQEQLLVLPLSEIKKFQNGVNHDVKLPNGIEAVIDWRGVESYSMGRNISSFIQYSMLSNFQISSLSSGSSARNGSGVGAYGGAYKNEPFSISSIVSSLYEVEQYKELFKRNYRCTYNKNTQIFRIMTSIDVPLVLTCMVRLSPSELYNDYKFEDYIVACCEEQLGRILSAFDSKLIGEIQINFADIKESGKETKEKIEEEIKDSNIMDIIMQK